MQYYDNMRAGTDDFFTTFLGLQLQMSIFIRDTSGSPSGRLKIFDVDDKAPYSNDKGRFISEMGNTPYSEYKDWIQSVWKIKEYLFEGLRGDIFAWGRVSDAAKMFWNQLTAQVHELNFIEITIFWDILLITARCNQG